MSCKHLQISHLFVGFYESRTKILVPKRGFTRGTTSIKFKDTQLDSDLGRHLATEQ